jgi:MoaA/NifB/PqqE/SkfB family radical SAM enzyme
MTFCYSPWTNVDISPTGDITPCCKFQKQYYNERFNIQTHSLGEYSDSKLVNDIKQEFQQGLWPRGCESCRIEESNGIESKRQLDYTRWKHHYELYNFENLKFITTSIAFGNTCNLKCITCGAHSSSRWQQEYFEIYGKDIPHFKFYKKNFVQDFISQAPDIVHLDIPGGEPFLSGVKEQKSLLLHYVNSGQAKNITLHYTTNAQVFPDTEWWELWSHFKEIDIQLSIDGVGDRYEYIRYPANWLLLIDNVIKYQQMKCINLRLSISHTVSAYNIYYLDEFFEWCHTMNLPRPWLGRIHTPQHMRPGVWSDSARQAIINRLKTSQHPGVLTWAKLMATVDESEFFDEFKTKLQAHDHYRNTNFKKVFPELAEYI